MTDRLMSLREAGQLLGVSKSTLQRWDRDGKLVAARTEGGHRRYRSSDVFGLVGCKDDVSGRGGDAMSVATYARCSSSDQKKHGDLDRQSSRLVEHCARRGYLLEHVIKDVGSGLNDRRKGFARLCELVIGRKIGKVVIEHKDRLTRFQFNLIRMFFGSYGVEIEVLDDGERTRKEELVEDMMMLIASFSGRVYGARSRDNRKAKES